MVILGSSRAGKSTLAKMVVKKYPYYHILGGDSIRRAFQEVLPQNQINNKGGSGMEHDFPNFLTTLFYRNIKINTGEFQYILDTCDILPMKTKELFDQEDTSWDREKVLENTLK